MHKSKTRLSEYLYQNCRCQECKTAFLEYSRNWRRNNKKKLKKSRRQYYKTHKAEIDIKRQRDFRLNSNLYNDINRKIGHLYSAAKCLARKKSLKWEISKDYYSELRKQNCDYCSGALNPTGVGLDRLDSSKGYVKSNVVPCCWMCNNIKGSKFTAEETKVMVNALLNFRAKVRIL